MHAYCGQSVHTVYAHVNILLQVLQYGFFAISAVFCSISTHFKMFSYGNQIQIN